MTGYIIGPGYMILSINKWLHNVSCGNWSVATQSMSTKSKEKVASE